MLTTRELILRLHLIRSDLALKYPISRLALFGSYARGEQTEGSDVDLWFEFDGVVGSRFIDLAVELEHMLGLTVHLVSGNGINTGYAKLITRNLIDV
jgi:predicted nucleotidyltransferase